MERTAILEGLAAIPEIDVLVIGGGINGGGVFRDLALQGTGVLLVERGDFCSGASSASSHMAHGGIRYLENGEFRLVAEAVAERNRLIVNAPHLVKPLPTVIPMFRLLSGILNAPLKFLGILDRPSERGALVIKLGLLFYEAFTRGRRVVPHHRFEGKHASLKRFPALNPDIAFTATYYDGVILSPERLALEVLLDGEAEGDHARALNYVSARGPGETAGETILRDEMTGRDFAVRPRVIVNAAGPWIDRVNAGLGLGGSYVGGTKGSHIILDHPELRSAIGSNEFFFENSDGRIVLLLPWHGHVIVGTSDLPIDDPDEAVCTEEEIDYFIGLVARVFPAIRIGREHIVFAFSGVRPLAFSAAKDTSLIGRDHVTREDRLGDLPVLSLVGGKWTTFRALAEQTTDRILSLLGASRRTGTADLPIGGGRLWPRGPGTKTAAIAAIAGTGGIGPERARILWDRYGTRAGEIAATIATMQDGPLEAARSGSRAEIAFLASREKALHLDDVLLRRSPLAWLGGVDRPLLEEVAAIMGAELEWSASETRAEVERTREILRERHGLRID